MFETHEKNTFILCHTRTIIAPRTCRTAHWCVLWGHRDTHAITFAFSINPLLILAWFGFSPGSAHINTTPLKTGSFSLLRSLISSVALSRRSTTNQVPNPQKTTLLLCSRPAARRGGWEAAALAPVFVRGAADMVKPLCICINTIKISWWGLRDQSLKLMLSSLCLFGTFHRGEKQLLVNPGRKKGPIIVITILIITITCTNTLQTTFEALKLVFCVTFLQLLTLSAVLCQAEWPQQLERPDTPPSSPWGPDRLYLALISAGANNK